jgi:hypothetical protein
MREDGAVRRVLIAAGLLVACVGLLLCWPLSRAFLTYERGHARVLDVYRLPQAEGQVSLRAIWEVEVSPGRWVLGDVQRNQYFRPMDDPVLAEDEVAAATARVLPDHLGRQTLVRAFWSANDPDGTAFIIDVSESHPWRRYILGLAACGAGLVVARLAWASRRWRTA